MINLILLKENLHKCVETLSFHSLLSLSRGIILQELIYILPNHVSILLSDMYAYMIHSHKVWF